MIKQLSNIVLNVSEQMVLVDFISFEGYVVAFLGLIRFSSLSISHSPTSLNEKLGIFFNLLLISKTLGWFLYVYCFFNRVNFVAISINDVRVFIFF